MLFGEPALEPLINKLCYLPSQMIVTYGFLYFLIPSLSNSQYLKFAGWFVVVAYIALVLARFMKIYVYETVIGHDIAKDSIVEILTYIPALLGQYAIWVFLTPLLTVMIVLLINHLQEKERLEKLKKEKNQAELRFLKAQIHPHFLFNTLNNLYTLSIQKSPKTADIAQKLYDILDYMFNNGSRATISIEEEINLISNYIELERIRYTDRLDLVFIKDVDDNQMPIVPLMLLSMVENAFKHGASGDLGSPKIKIELVLKETQLTFSIFNTKPAALAIDKKGYRKGIGIQNIKRQLAILYPVAFDYQIEETKETYSAVLHVDLDGFKPILKDISIIQKHKPAIV